MNNNHIIFEYDKYLKEYKKKYGENTILLMQIGSFFEMCSIIEPDNNIGESNIHNICDDILNVVVGKKYYKSTNKDTGESEQKVYYMGGFPLVAQEKYLTFLLNNNYTVVLVEQVTEPPNPERKVTKILSPGTDITYNKKQSNFLLSIYIEKYKYNKEDIFEAGISAIDLSTGKNYIHNIKNDSDNNYCIDEISRLINFYNPSELIFQTENYNLSREDVINKWDILHDCYRINHYNDNKYKKPSYQINLLNDLFKFNNMLSILENLNLDKHNCLRLSYVYLIEYINEHKVNVLINIEKPLECEEKNFLNLTANSIRQLNVVNNYSYFKGKNESLLSICNICLTSMGKRMFKNRLLYPLIDPEKINNRYNKIEVFQNNKYYNIIRSELIHIQDLEKTLRLMSLDLIDPYHLVSTYLSYEYVNKIIENIKDNYIYRLYNNYEEDIINFKNFRIELKDIFNFNNITNDPVHLINRSIFNIGINIEIDNIDKEIVDLNKNINNIANKLCSYIDSYDSNSVKVYISKEKDIYGLYTTKKRGETLKKKLKNLLDKDICIKDNGSSGKTLYKIIAKDISFKSKDGSNIWIEIPLMKTLSKKGYDLFNNLSKINKNLYEQKIKMLYSKYNISLKKINKFISDIDVS
jgi:DNA mismatch repair protein MutS